MATCPVCHYSGSNWLYCEACNRTFCKNCEKKNGTYKASNKCPFCGTYNKLKPKK